MNTRSARNFKQSIYANGIEANIFFSKPESTRLSLLARRRCLRDLELRRWRVLGDLRITLPVPVILKRLEIDLRVFCMAERVGTKTTGGLL